MKNIINILDDLTINKIAAGEVVERPSSVAKELIENSIDAKSTKITIEIVDGGKKLIRITDNGIGIPSSEVHKSFLRHATSKIKDIDDLYDLYSLGFRGEALASISAVSKLEMITKTKDEPLGTKVVLEGGKIIKKEPIGTTNGTTLIIKDIFFNTPARQKFLKSSHAETINISDLINKLAIGNPQIQFRYINNNKIMLNTPGNNKLKDTVRSIYGKDITENLVEATIKNDIIEAYGYIGDNNIYRSNRNLQHVYINNRFVKSKIILDAINEGYKGLIPINKYGVCFLNLEIDPSKIDVNIHPTKLEVKFEDDNKIYIILRDFIKKTLLSSTLVGKYKAPESNYKSQLTQFIDKKNIESITNKTPSISEDINKIFNFESFKNIDSTNNKIDNNDSKVEEPIIQYKENNTLKVEALNIDKKFTMDELEYLDTTNNKKLIENDIQEEFKLDSTSELNSKFSLIDYNVIGTIFDTYIIMQKSSSMFLLDQHAAHERILFEKYISKFKNENINMQILLDPLVIEVSNVDMLEIEKNTDLFKRFGFEIELFGNNHIMVRSVPNVFGVPESEKFITEIIDNLSDVKNNYDLKSEKFASMACKSAIKANDKIHLIEIKRLFSMLEACENPFTCPHGRPILVEITKTEIEKMFKRIM